MNNFNMHDLKKIKAMVLRNREARLALYLKMYLFPPKKYSSNVLKLIVDGTRNAKSNCNQYHNQYIIHNKMPIPGDEDKVYAFMILTAIFN